MFILALVAKPAGLELYREIAESCMCGLSLLMLHMELPHCAGGISVMFWPGFLEVTWDTPTKVSLAVCQELLHAVILSSPVLTSK